MRSIRQRHRFHLEDPIDGRHLNIFRQSIFGLLRVHNLLDPEIVDAPSVAASQGSLQQALLARACGGCADWAETFSPRIDLCSHPLR